MNETICKRIEALREVMKREGMDAFIFPSTDPHNGEYVPEHWEGRKWISGFNGSAGTAVVTMDDAALWTDSRYFLAAEEQLRGHGLQPDEGAHRGHAVHHEMARHEACPG